MKAMLLAGDGTLRRNAEKGGIEVHGILWVFDEFVEAGILETSIALQKMELLIKINPRLPLQECHNRMKKWRE
jgi:hypothetical protein